MSDIEIKLVRPLVEELLARYETQIGKDLPGYKNHVYRTITYAMHFLANDEQYEKLVETAFAYHDIGLWTDAKLAYLEPSEALVLLDNQKYGWGLDESALTGAIHWHHKITAYKGEHEQLINACRKADWIDASMGLVKKGLPKATIKQVEAAFPNFGFHKTLVRLAKDLGGSTLIGGYQVTRGIMKW